jgi:hypothetical protein
LDAEHSKTRRFAVGGTVVTNPGTFDPVKMSPEGQTFHGDHAYVFYQIPVNARKLPLVLWHGYGQFSKTWETHRTDARGTKVFSCDVVSEFMCLSSLAAAMQAAAPSR